MNILMYQNSFYQDKKSKKEVTTLYKMMQQMQQNKINNTNSMSAKWSRSADPAILPYKTTAGISRG